MSIIGILVILTIICCFIFADFAFGLGFGYKKSDLLIVGLIALVSGLLFASVRLIGRRVGHW